MDSRPGVAASAGSLMRRRGLRLAGLPKVTCPRCRLRSAHCNAFRHGEHIAVRSQEKLAVQCFHGQLQIRFAYSKPEAQRRRPLGGQPYVCDPQSCARARQCGGHVGNPFAHQVVDSRLVPSKRKVETTARPASSGRNFTSGAKRNWCIRSRRVLTTFAGATMPRSGL